MQEARRNNRNHINARIKKNYRRKKKLRERGENLKPTKRKVRKPQAHKKKGARTARPQRERCENLKKVLQCSHAGIHEVEEGDPIEVGVIVKALRIVEEAANTFGKRWLV